MKTPGEVARSLSACIICGGTPLVAFGHAIPMDDRTYAAVLKLREQPVPDDELPTLHYALCRRHARNLQRSAALVQEIILAAAGKVTVQ